MIRQRQKWAYVVHSLVLFVEQVDVICRLSTGGIPAAFRLGIDFTCWQATASFLNYLCN